ncbi:hypothetical protein ACIVBQ_001354 [Tenacibaculum discolor]
MLTDKEMLETAKLYLKKINGSKDDELVIVSELIIKKKYGNIYYCEFKKFLETGDSKYSVPLDAPFLVEKETRRVVQFGTSGHLEDHLKAYEDGTFEPSHRGYWYPDEDRFDYK